MNIATNKCWERKDWYYIFALCGLIFLYFYEILSLKVGFYSGDHRQQHYPWAFFYAQQLKQGILPWWTSLFGCGFPLLAEGQVGALYPLNFIFYKFLPFDFAYTYNILFHYILGASFFYLFIRSLRLSGFASFFGSLIYLFGTAQGGYYYNIISLKTLVWFPLGLFFVFRIFKNQKYSLFFWLAVLFSFQFCAGYLQYAVYSITFTGITCLWLAAQSIWEGQPRAAFLGLTSSLAAVVLGMLCAFPQLGATLELSSFSNRFDFPTEFAFVGSVNPLAIATLFFPHWDSFLRAEFYLGALGLLFFIHSFHKSQLMVKSYLFLGFFVALLLALGGFNPLYRWVVEWSNFSSFRIPAKFLYFVGFYGASLCAYGAEAWFTGGLSLRWKSWKLWTAFSTLAGIGLITTHYLLKFFREELLEYLSEYIKNNFEGSVIRPHSMDVYQQKLLDFYDGVIQVTTPLQTDNLIFVLLMFISVVLVAFSLNNNWSRVKLVVFFTPLLFLNLWCYGNTSIRGNYEMKETLQPSGKIVDTLKESDRDGRLHRVFRDIYGAAALPLRPHNTMLIPQPMVGAYTPLVLKGFYDWMTNLGDVNDSNTVKVSSKEKFKSSGESVDFLNIEWILSDHAFTFDRYDFIKEEDGAFLYRNPHVRPRATFEKLSDLPIIIDDRQNSVLLEFETSASDQLFMSDILYPGWEAELNGQSTELNTHQTLFRHVLIPSAGAWKLEMTYNPIWKQWLLPSGCLTLLLGMLPFFFRRNNEP